MKEMLQFKPFCWHSGLFDKCMLLLQKMLMIVLNIQAQYTNKRNLSIGPFTGWEKLHKHDNHKCA